MFSTDPGAQVTVSIRVHSGIGLEGIDPVA